MFPLHTPNPTDAPLVYLAEALSIQPSGIRADSASPCTY
jgi:hypothetical protein